MLIDALITQLTVSHSSIHRNLQGVSSDESTARPDSGGNSANWVVGHILASRNGLLKALGEKTVIADERVVMYRRGTDGSAVDGLPLEDLVAALDESQALLLASLRSAPEALLAAKSPIKTPAGPDATFGAAIAFMVFHESYHAGQLGILRRLLGKTGAI